MNFIVVISSNDELNHEIEVIINQNFPGYFNLFFPPSEKFVLDALNFEIPELVLFNFSDKDFNLDSIKENIRKDSWLHNFGIIGLYDSKQDKDSVILEKYSELNILTLLDYSKVKRELVKSIRIIHENRQLIHQENISEKLVRQFTGSFYISNSDVTVVPVYTGLLAISLSRMGKVPEEDRYNLQMALTELILNGIEHGNCKIDYEEKTRYLMKGGGMHELVIEKNQDPDIAAKRVTLSWEIDDEQCRFSIEDQGEGFDVMAYREKLKNSNQDELHGRGILMANMVADKISFNKKGNRVTLIINSKKTGVQRSTPQGFAGEEILDVNEGDVVMKAGDLADCIYYISSGEYTVLYKDTPVGKITPVDLFMGEMAFLLNNRRSATVVADSPGRIIKIPRRSFISIIKEYPQYSVFLAKLLAQKLAKANEKTTHIAGYYREMGASLYNND